MKKYHKVILWFRRDLRLLDQRALFEACEQAKEVLPIFIFDQHILSQLKDKDDARVSFIYDVIIDLQSQLAKKNKKILVLHGKPEEIIPVLCQRHQVEAVFVNEDYEPRAIERDLKVECLLKKINIKLHSYKDHVITAPSEIKNGQDRPYQVFTPYKNKWLSNLDERADLLKSYAPKLKFLIDISLVDRSDFSLNDLGFSANRLCLADVDSVLNFFERKIVSYHQTRDFPAIAGTSRLSVHLRFGTISVRELVRRALLINGGGRDVWLSEIIWREFYVMIMGNFPHVVSNAYKPQYDKIIWPNKKEWFERWCEGQTGFPIIDAGMRELNTTGWMHNRVRMITASFLCKILLIDWRMGEEYFARKLLDFDLSANNGGWQWCSSSGCDAAPYFRIFNPYTQTKKFDPEGQYLRMFAPLIGASPIVNYPEQRARCLMLYKKYL